MSDTWDGFVTVVREEARLLRELSASARHVTDALVKNKPPLIEAAHRRIDAARLRYETAANARQAMQRRGFGGLPLRTVAGYAPPELAPALHAAVSELAFSAIGLKITNDNNKALVRAGFERLERTVAVLQNARSEKVGVYKRRGVIPRQSPSVLLSQRA